MGSTFETGNYVRDYISLKHVWDNIMMGKLGKMYVPGERFHQASNEDLMDLLVEFEEKKVKQIHFIVEYLPLNVINHEPNAKPNIRQVPKPNPKQGPYLTIVLILSPTTLAQQPAYLTNQPTQPAYLKLLF
ncbi:hypothetical protein ACOSQ2_009894 [Xanthoceras sorbifolium]